MKMTTATHPKSQVEKFREAARELETDDSEEAFDRVLRRISKVPNKPDSRDTKTRPSQALRGKSLLGD